MMTAGEMGARTRGRARQAVEVPDDEPDRYVADPAVDVEVEPAVRRMSGSPTEWPSWERLPWHQELDGGLFGDDSARLRAAVNRNEPRRIVRVVVSSTTPVAVAGQSCRDGENFLLVYESEVEKIRRMLPSEEQRMYLRTAHAQYEAEFERYVVEECGGDRAKAEQTRGFSPWTSYDHLTRNFKHLRGGYPAVRELEVGPEAPPPETPDSVHERSARALVASQTANSEALGDAISKGIAEGMKAIEASRKKTG